MWIEIDLIKKEGKTYSIVLHADAPQMTERYYDQTVETKWGERTFERKEMVREPIGGYCLMKRFANLDEAKKCAEKVWLENFIGAMKKIMIYCEGERGVLFEADNYSKFKRGSKQAEGTPF